MSAYRYYKLNCTAGNSGGAFMINEIELYSWIPPMTGEDFTTTSMTVTDNQNNGTGYEGFQVYNDTPAVINGDNCRWQKNSQSYPIWVKIDLGAGNAQEVVSYMVMANDPTYAPKDWTLEGSDDDSSWTTVFTVTNQTGWYWGEKRIYTKSNDFTLSGTVKDYSGSGIVRTVRAIRKSDGAYLGETVSASGTGIWSIGAPTEGPFQIIEFKSDTDDEEAHIYDAVVAV